MPRKFNHSADYEDYDYYEDLDNDYDRGENDDNGLETYQRSAARTKQGLWRCLICTFDNDESLIACDICGILRNPLPIGDTKSERSFSVNGICKDSGVSVMAKGLFTPCPHGTCEKDVIFPAKSVELVRKEVAPCMSVAPFKFEVPSPDDLVTSGMRTKMVSQGTTLVGHASSNAATDTLKLPSISAGGLAKSMTMAGDSTTGYRSQHNAGGDEKLASYQQVKGKGHNDTAPDSFNSSTVNGGCENLNGGLKSLKLSSPSLAEYKPEKWMAPLKSEDNLTQLNLAIVGHVDSGKSTLSGRLLHLLGHISQKDMHKYEREARMQGKVSFRYAWALDESSEERERGITMTVAVAYFETKKYHVVLLDSPGHKDFVPNMISGAAQADAAILVVDASIGSFEAGMDSMMGQTREHARLIRSSGVDQIIVAVNKLDSVEYSQERFNMIKGQLGSFLRSCGYKDLCLSWIPISVMENQNLVCASDLHLLSWYHGPCLLDAIDSLRSPEREFSKPPIMPISDVIKLHSTGLLSACGKLEAGAFRSGSKVLVMPSGISGTVHSLERDGRLCAAARAGDYVAVAIQGIDSSHILAGDVLCHPDYPVGIGKRLELKVIVFEIDIPILIGSQLEFHIHHAKGAACVGKLTSLLDPKTGSVTKKSPRCIFSKQTALLEIVLQRTVCVEEFSKCRALGRVYLRTSGRTAAVGIVTRVVE